MISEPGNLIAYLSVAAAATAVFSVACLLIARIKRKRREPPQVMRFRPHDQIPDGEPLALKEFLEDVDRADRRVAAPKKGRP